MVKLSLRLQTIADMVPQSIVADVGSDHGKLMIHLFESGKIQHGYAIENKRGPYNRLVDSLTKAKIEDYIVPLFSDGISELPLCVNTVVIAGMGGLAVCKILTSHAAKLKNVDTIIVDAHSNVMEVRKTVVDLGYIIAEEKMVKDADVYYEIIKFIKGEEAIYSDEDLEYGPFLRKERSAVFKEKYNNRLSEISLLLMKNLPENRSLSLKQEKIKILGIIDENKNAPTQTK